MNDGMKIGLSPAFIASTDIEPHNGMEKLVW